MRLRVATRGSRLALWQAETVVALLGAPAEYVDYVIVQTTGDRSADVDLHAIGGQGVFVKEVQQAVLEGRADLAVHSAKDLPAVTPDGLTLACFPERADPRDALVGAPLDEIPTGGRIGTGSVRRRAQLAAARPDLGFGLLRGNIETRLRKGSEFDAIVVALAALERLDLVGQVAEVLDPSVMLPQVGQGALAVECRSDDAELLGALAHVDRPEVRAAVVAERAFLAAFGGGCDLPVAALGRLGGDVVMLDALVAALDGRIVLRTDVTGEDPRAVGAAAAADLLDSCGARALLDLDAPRGEAAGGVDGSGNEAGGR